MTIAWPLASRRVPRKAPEVGSKALIRPSGTLLATSKVLLNGPKSPGAIATPQGECSGPVMRVSTSPAGLNSTTKPEDDLLPPTAPSCDVFTAIRALVGSRLGFQPLMVPSRVAKRKRAGADASPFETE